MNFYYARDAGGLEDALRRLLDTLLKEKNAVG